MTEFSKSWLDKQGVKTTELKLTKLSNDLEAILEMRVGDVLASHLSDNQIEEFEKVLEVTDDDDKDDKRINWLEKNYPDYKKVVHSQKAKLSRQIRKADDKIKVIEQFTSTELN